LSAHTPGPWHLVEGHLSGELRIHPDLGGKPAGVALAIGSRAMSFIPHRTGSHRGEKMRYGKFSETDKANANLIAAAPELLEALYGIARYTRSEVPGGCWCSPEYSARNPISHGEACTFARAAIAKAAGRAVRS